MRKDVNGAAQAYFLWQGDDLLAELTGTATGKVAEYSYYPGLDKPHAVITGTTTHFAHVDGIGSVIALTDSAKSVKRDYDFDAWGGLRGGTDYKPFSNADRARFKGALWLGPQVDLYFMRARWYEPKSGRFLSEDPIGLSGGTNPYAYAADDPVNDRDPRGTCPENTVMEITINVSDGSWTAKCVWAGGGSGPGMGGSARGSRGGDYRAGLGMPGSTPVGWWWQGALWEWSPVFQGGDRRPRFIWPGYPDDRTFLVCPVKVVGLFTSVRMRRGDGALFLAELDVDVDRVFIEGAIGFYRGRISAVSTDPNVQDWWSGPVRGTADCVTGRAVLHGVGP